MADIDCPGLVAVDGHCHLHESFRPSLAFEAALRHVAKAAAVDDDIATDRAVLCLADPREGAHHRRLLGQASNLETSNWTLAATEEDGSVLARRGDGARLALVAGRQVTTSEQLEVLVLATTTPIPDGESLRDTVRRGLAAGAIVILAWGFGKWWFDRGAAVRDLLRSPLAERLYVGDNAGRLATGPHLGLLRLARERGIGILPGSDPLPLPGQAQRVGRYGFLLPSFPLAKRPAAELRSLLADGGAQPKPYGRIDPAMRAVMNQIRLRIARDSG